MRLSERIANIAIPVDGKSSFRLNAHIIEQIDPELRDLANDIATVLAKTPSYYFSEEVFKRLSQFVTDNK